MDRTITHDQGQTMLFHRRSLALVGLLIALLTTLAIQPATAAAQSISYSSGPRNLISDGGFESEQSAWRSVESPYRTSQSAHCGSWSMNLAGLATARSFKK